METHYIAIIAALGAALLTGLFTTLVALMSNRQNARIMEKSFKENHQTTIEASRIQTVAPMKEAWKNKIREIMAQLLASLHGSSDVTTHDRNVLLYQLELLLDDKRDVLCSEIRRAIRLVGIENRNHETEQELIQSVNQCASLCREFTDETWKDIQGKGREPEESAIQAT